MINSMLLFIQNDTMESDYSGDVHNVSYLLDDKHLLVWSSKIN